MVLLELAGSLSTPRDSGSARRREDPPSARPALLRWGRDGAAPRNVMVWQEILSSCWTHIKSLAIPGFLSRPFNWDCCLSHSEERQMGIGCFRLNCQAL